MACIRSTVPAKHQFPAPFGEEGRADPVLLLNPAPLNMGFQPGPRTRAATAPPALATPPKDGAGADKFKMVGHSGQRVLGTIGDVAGKRKKMAEELLAGGGKYALGADAEARFVKTFGMPLIEAAAIGMLLSAREVMEAYELDAHELADRMLDYGARDIYL